jgi:hypothetical protein
MVLVQKELKNAYIWSNPVKRATIRVNGVEKQVRPTWIQWNGDLSKISTVKTYSLASPIQYAYSLQFNDDGTKFYVAWYKWVGTWRIQQYSMSTPRDITTATNDVNIDFWTANSSFGNYPSMLLANNWQLIFFQDYAGWSNNRLIKYTLATAWDINSTKTMDTTTSWIYLPQWMSDDGKAFIWNVDSNTWFYYSTNSTAWTVNTSWTNIGSGKAGWAKFSNDGKFLYLLNSSKSIVKYSLSTDWDPTSKTEVQSATLSYWGNWLYFDTNWDNLYTCYWSTLYQYPLV